MVDKLFIFALSCQHAKIYIYRWIYVMWTYLHREFLTIFGQCINVLNYKYIHVYTVLSKSLGSAFQPISWLFGAFSMKFRLKRKFGDISANFRDAYCPNPRKLSNYISLCSKYRRENSVKNALVSKIRCEFSSKLLFRAPSVFEESSNAMIEI